MLRAAAEAIFASEAGAPPRERIDWLLADFADYLNHAGTRARLVMAFALAVIAVLTFLTTLRFFSWMSVQHRVAALTRIERGFAGGAVLAVKAFLSVLWYEHPDVQREIGFSR